MNTTSLSPTYSYDGGDCCSCTACSGSECALEEGGYFHCIDPAAPCFGEEGDAAADDERYSSSGRAASARDDGSSSLTCTGEFASWVGDGICDAFLNTEECRWDGGDVSTTTSRFRNSV